MSYVRYYRQDEVTHFKQKLPLVGSSLCIGTVLMIQLGLQLCSQACGALIRYDGSLRSSCCLFRVARTVVLRWGLVATSLPRWQSCLSKGEASEPSGAEIVDLIWVELVSWAELSCAESSGYTKRVD